MGASVRCKQEHPTMSASTDDAKRTRRLLFRDEVMGAAVSALEFGSGA